MISKTHHPAFKQVLKPLFISLILICHLGISLGQEQAPPEKKAPEPIPTADIFQESENTESILAKSAELAVPLKKIETINNNLPAYFKSVDELNEGIDLNELNNLGLNKLNDLLQSSQLHQEKLNLWQKQLAERSSDLEQERLLLSGLKERWEITYNNAKSESTPPEVLNRIESLINKIHSTEQLLRKSFGHVMAIQNRLSLKIGEISETMDLIKEGISVKKAEAFKLDSEPLWQVLFVHKPREKSLTELFASTVKAHQATFKEFYRNYGDRTKTHILIFLILLGILFIFRRFGKQLIIDKEAAEISREILNHPYSVALLTSLLLTSQLYPQAPTLISKLAQIASLIPILRLFPVLTIPKIKSNLLIFMLLYLLMLIYDLSPEHTLTHRLFLLLISILGIIFFVWVAKKGGIKKLSDQDRLVLYFAYLIRSLIPLLGIAVITNILGNVVLASILTVGSLSSIYAAIMLLAAGLVIVSLVNLLMSTRIAFISRSIRVHSRLIIENISKFIHFVALILWIYITLRQFNLWDYFSGGILSIFTERLQVGEVDISLGDVVIFVISIYASIIISKFIRFILNEDVFVRIRLPRGVPAAISMLINYAIIGLGFMIALTAAGFDLNRFAIVLGALGVGIGFGLQNIVNNFISGLVLIFERPIQVGDVVELTNLLGHVKRIGIRSSTIRTFDGSEVIVPNGNLISNEVINWTLSDKLRRVQITVGTSYGSNPEQVLNLLQGIVDNHPDVLDNPRPIILFQEFGESSLNFNVRFWTASADTWMELKSAITVEIFRVFKENKIEIPFPQRDLHLKSANPAVFGPISKSSEPGNSGRVAPKISPAPTSDAQDAQPKKRKPNSGKSVKSQKNSNSDNS